MTIQKTRQRPGYEQQRQHVNHINQQDSYTTTDDNVVNHGISTNERLQQRKLSRGDNEQQKSQQR